MTVISNLGPFLKVEIKRIKIKTLKFYEKQKFKMLITKERYVFIIQT